MASGVNIKMGVSGVAQFKSAMKESQSAVKTLDAELKLNEAQLKLTGDAEEYLKNKTSLLQKQIEEQSQVVKAAQDALEAMRKNGVSESSEAFRKMQQELLNSQTKLANMETSLRNVGEAGEDAKNEVSGINHQLQRIGDGVDYQNVIQGFDTLKAGIGSVISKAWQMGEALVKATLGAGSWADELQTTADQYEITPEELQRMRKTANLIDTDAETILEAQDKLKKNRESQSKEAMGALAYLGIDPDGMSDLDLFWKAGEAIQKLGKNEDKVTYAQRLFGKSWRELLPLFKAGRTEYEKTFDSWNVVEQDQLDALGKMDDSYQKMTSEWETFKMEMLSAFSGPLTEGMDTITGLFKELNNYLDTPEGKAMLQQLGDTITTLITDLVNLDPEDAISKLKGVVDGITNAFKWIEKNHDKVVSGIKAIGAAFIGLKLATLASNITSLVNGLGNLMGKGGTPTVAPTGGTGGGGDGGAVAAAGGALTAAKNAINGKALNLAGIANVSNMTAATFFADWFSRYTNAGRYINPDFGGSFSFENLMAGFWQDVNEWAEKTVETNEKIKTGEASYIGDPKALEKRKNWEESEAQKKAANEWYKENSAPVEGIISPEEFQKMTLQEQQLYMAELRAAGVHPATQEEKIKGYQAATGEWNALPGSQKMEEVAAEMNGTASDATKANKEMTEAAVEMMTLPELMTAAVLNGLRNVSINFDGKSVADILAPYISEELAGQLRVNE